MSSEPAVRFDGVTKSYRRRSGRAALVEMLRPSTVTRFDALADLDLAIDAGERVGFVGDNGAGKTTALRLMTGISRPTRGTTTVRGRVGALIEVGSGIHPEMSGRENVLLYGNLLGFGRAEIRRRFDEIVAFAELGEVIDQQVKFYSSGMQLRLGFSIAAHLEPDVLIIDEALAVGDVRFQRKCIERMAGLSRSGATLVYVSHDHRSVEALCDRVVWLDHGRARADGPARDVLDAYLSTRRGEPTAALARIDQGANAIRLTGVTLRSADGAELETLDSGDPFRLELTFEGPPSRRPNVAVGFSFQGPHIHLVCSMAEHGTAPDQVGTRWRCILDIDELPLRRGEHDIWVGVLAEDAITEVMGWAHVATLVVAAPVGPGPRGLTEIGPLVVRHRFSVEDLGEGSS